MNSQVVVGISVYSTHLVDWMVPPSIALSLEPPRWRSTLALEGTSESAKKLFEELQDELDDREKRILRLQQLIRAFGYPYTDYTRVNEVMIKLKGMEKADEAIRSDLTRKRDKVMLAKTCAAAGGGYHSMRFVLPESFGTKSYIDVDRPLSRLQRCTDKNRHQIRTWMEKLFHTTATWEMSEQAYHEAIMNMMEGDVGAQAFKLKDLSLQDIIDTLIAKYDTTHRTPEEMNEELRKIKREKHQSPYQFRQVIESMFKQMIAVQPIPESDAQLRVLLRERLLANVGEKTKGKLEKLMARCHQSGGLASVDELYECAATSEAIKKDWVKGRGSKVSAWDGPTAGGGTAGASRLTGFERTATGAGTDVRLGTVFGAAGAATAGATVASSTGSFGASSEPSLNTTGSVDSCRFRGSGSTDSGASRFEAFGAIGAKFVNETAGRGN